MTILITGGGGYLGTVLVRELLRKTTHEIVVLDRFDYGVQPLLSVLHPAESTGVRLQRGDVRDRTAVEGAATGCDLIVHLAGIVGYPACDADPQDADSTNVEGTRLVCQQGVPVIFASTGSCYGKVDGLATEETPLSPLTRYGRNKVEGERIVLDTHCGTVLRFATLFGLAPRMRWDLLPNDFAMKGVKGQIDLYEPDARRTFLHVEDAARAIQLAIAGAIPAGVWNVGDAQLNWSKRELAAAVRAVTGCRITDGAGSDPDKRDYAVDYRKLAGTRFRPRYGLGESLPGMVAAARVWEGR